MVCSFRVKDDGNVCLVLFGDNEMPGYDSKSYSRPAYQAPEMEAE